MKERGGGTDCRSSKRRRRNQVSGGFFTAEELEVAEFLLDLRRLISRPRRLVWGKTKKRSPLSCIARPRNNRKEEDVEAGMPKVVTLSPNTPLSLSASDSDGKSTKKSKSDYADMIETLTQRRNLLLGEIEAVKKYRKRLVEFHSHLKACKSEMVNGAPQPQPSIGYPTVADYQRRMEDRRPLLIDLNVPYEEGKKPQTSDLGRGEIERRARCAEARRHRLGVMKRKNGRRVVGS